VNNNKVLALSFGAGIHEPADKVSAFLFILAKYLLSQLTDFCL
jgi:hypothetical protein